MGEMTAPDYGTTVLRHHLFVKSFKGILDAGGELQALRDPAHMIETLAGAGDDEMKAMFGASGDLDEVKEWLEGDVGKELMATQVGATGLKLKMIATSLVAQAARWIEDDEELSQSLALQEHPSTREALTGKCEEVVGRWLDSEMPEVKFAAAVGRARGRLDLLDLRRTKTVDFWSVVVAFLDG